MFIFTTSFRANFSRSRTSSFLLRLVPATRLPPCPSSHLRISVILLSTYLDATVPQPTSQVYTLRSHHYSLTCRIRVIPLPYRPGPFLASFCWKLIHHRHHPLLVPEIFFFSLLRFVLCCFSFVAQDVFPIHGPPPATRRAPSRLLPSRPGAFGKRVMGKHITLLLLQSGEDA